MLAGVGQKPKSHSSFASVYSYGANEVEEQDYKIQATDKTTIH